MPTPTRSDPVESGQDLVALFRTMARIRAFEERVAHHFRAGDVHGFVHVSIGQEAVAAGVCAALSPEDYITTTHRGHGHCLAKGADPVGMIAELFGRDTGLCRGRGGSMHLADAACGILGANGIVGAGIPLATGAALAAQAHGKGQAAVAFFGEGALHTGAFHEAATLAVAWRLPLLLLCESNGWAEFTPTDAWGGPAPVERAAAYGMAAAEVDGSDVLAVLDAASSALAAVRSGGGPAFLEAQTIRAHGHFEGDAQAYREDPEWQHRDPLARARELLGDRAEEADALVEGAQAEMRQAVEVALDAPYPPVDSLLENVYA